MTYITYRRQTAYAAIQLKIDSFLSPELVTNAV